MEVTQTDWRTGLTGANSTVKTVIPHYSFLNPNKTFESFTLAQKFGHLFTFSELQHHNGFKALPSRELGLQDSQVARGFVRAINGKTTMERLLLY